MRELKAYFLAHRNDKEAFEAYMDRLQEKPQQVIIGATEIDNLTVAEQIQIITAPGNARISRSEIA